MHDFVKEASSLLWASLIRDAGCLILPALQAFYSPGPRRYMCRRDPIRERDRYWILIERVLRKIC
ncbi:MAG: hypothetical protein AUI97_09635 [Crenarchaeota archaeon 13_1_40CM_3_52_17]|nr:MAG: hypothetical protein AUI97_09635 [Crenarchaeota archaeon 13_1_40CM_3_52_17]